MNAVCLIIDRLHAGYVGAYGNGWIETPAIDRLAVESCVFDQALVDTPELELLYRSYWQGWHALCPPPPANRPTLPRMLRAAGIHTALLTDERLLRHPLAADFDELVDIEPSCPRQVAGQRQLEQTHLARSFARIIDWLQTAQRPFLLWCHLAGLGTTWDAPLECRRRYWDEDCAPPPDTTDVPHRMLDADCGPGAVLSISHAYAGQVSLLDTCVGALREALAESLALQDTLLVLTAPRGFPLGEHGRLGPCDDPLYTELVQVPLMLRFPDGLAAATRSQALVEPADLWATLLDWWQVADVPRSPSAVSLMPVVREETSMLRDRLCMAGPGGQRAIRTPAWHLRMAAAPELFVKPDDRWEVNNVATRCLEVGECLQDALLECEQTLQAGQLSDLPPLNDVLLNGLE